MGVYIKGMEMPKSCGECLGIGFHYVFECRLDDVEEGEKLPNCPLAPVPPHGRLIDADALMKNEENISFKDEWHMTVTEAFVSVKNIAHAPTIIEAEEGET